jgi:hypothetical protein
MLDGQATTLQRHLADVGGVFPREPRDREVLTGSIGASPAGGTPAAAAAALLACCGAIIVDNRHLRRGTALAAGRLRSCAPLRRRGRQQIGRCCRGGAAVAGALGPKDRGGCVAAVACCVSSVICASIRLL